MRAAVLLGATAVLTLVAGCGDATGGPSSAASPADAALDVQDTPETSRPPATDAAAEMTQLGPGCDVLGLTMEDLQAVLPTRQLDLLNRDAPGPGAAALCRTDQAPREPGDPPTRLAAAYNVWPAENFERFEEFVELERLQVAPETTVSPLPGMGDRAVEVRGASGSGRERYGILVAVEDLYIGVRALHRSVNEPDLGAVLEESAETLANLAVDSVRAGR